MKLLAILILLALATGAQAGRMPADTTDYYISAIDTTGLRIFLD